MRVRYAVRRHNGRIRFLMFINKLFVILAIKYLYVAIKHNCIKMLDFTDEKNLQLEQETNEIVAEFDEEAQLKIEIIQTLLEPCGLAKRGTA